MGQILQGTKFVGNTPDECPTFDFGGAYDDYSMVVVDKGRKLGTCLIEGRTLEFIHPSGWKFVVRCCTFPEHLEPQVGRDFGLPQIEKVLSPDGTEYRLVIWQTENYWTRSHCFSSAEKAANFCWGLRSTGGVRNRWVK